MCKYCDFQYVTFIDPVAWVDGYQTVVKRLVLTLYLLEISHCCNPAKLYQFIPFNIHLASLVWIFNNLHFNCMQDVYQWMDVWYILVFFFHIVIKYGYYNCAVICCDTHCKTVSTLSTLSTVWRSRGSNAVFDKWTIIHTFNDNTRDKNVQYQSNNRTQFTRPHCCT